MSKKQLDYIYDLLYDIKTEEELQREVEYLAHRLSSIAKTRRGEGKSIDERIKQILGYSEE